MSSDRWLLLFIVNEMSSNLWIDRIDVSHHINKDQLRLEDNLNILS